MINTSKRLIAAATLGFLPALGGTPAAADDLSDLLKTLQEQCVAPLEARTKLAAGLTRAEPELEARLVQGRPGQLYTTKNGRIVVIAWTSGRVCEVMALGQSPVMVGYGIELWAENYGYRVDPTSYMPYDVDGQAYAAKAIGTGYIQVDVQSSASTGLIVITAIRLQESERAKALLETPAEQLQDLVPMREDPDAPAEPPPGDAPAEPEPGVPAPEPVTPVPAPAPGVEPTR